MFTFEGTVLIIIEFKLRGITTVVFVPKSKRKRGLDLLPGISSPAIQVDPGLKVYDPQDIVVVGFGIEAKVDAAGVRTAGQAGQGLVLAGRRVPHNVGVVRPRRRENYAVGVATETEIAAVSEVGKHPTVGAIEVVAGEGEDVFSVGGEEVSVSERYEVAPALADASESHQGFHGELQQKDVLDHLVRKIRASRPSVLLDRRISTTSYVGKRFARIIHTLSDFCDL